jgi:hypothetical protein
VWRPADFSQEIEQGLKPRDGCEIVARAPSRKVAQRGFAASFQRSEAEQKSLLSHGWTQMHTDNSFAF